ncbi:MAG: DUF924 domain-containing protein [Deltaproteobacteria bacterium]|nr:DUF924 domain-containing protein [Deltaproteobacteria bacterium]
MSGYDFRDIITFWFEETGPGDWWKGDPHFDHLIKNRFLGVHAAACRCELFRWREKPLGRLAEILLLDQFSRHIHRGTPASFAFDPMALALAQEAIRMGVQEHFSPPQKAFLYMPFMHSESSLIHEIAGKLFVEPGLERQLQFELRHKAIIDRFGRYPHRNQTLGRESTPEEREFLTQPGSSF